MIENRRHNVVCEGSNKLYICAINSVINPKPVYKSCTRRNMRQYIVSCGGLRVTEITGSRSVDWIY
jgi:hypothetical protein